jgi:hypothetical protein
MFVHIGKTGGTTAFDKLKRNWIKTEQIHMHPIDMAMLNHYTNIIISIRDPVERYISSFNNILANGPAPSKDVLFHECFNNISDAADAILSSTKCGHVLRSVSSHIGAGYCFYLGGIAIRNALKKHKNVYVIRQEYFDSDLELVMLKVGNRGRDNQKHKGHDIHSDHAVQSRAMSPEGAGKLRGYLEMKGEYSAYRELLRYSIHSH